MYATYVEVAVNIDKAVSQLRIDGKQSERRKTPTKRHLAEMSGMSKKSVLVCRAHRKDGGYGRR
jgi:hypothetical protein